MVIKELNVSLFHLENETFSCEMRILVHILYNIVSIISETKKLC